MKMNIEEIDFIKRNHMAVLSTCEDVQPHGAAIYYYFDQEDQSFYFVSKLGTQKIKNLLKNNRVALTIVDEENLSTSHVEGNASIFDGEIEEKIEILNKLNKIHSEKKFLATPVSLIKKGALGLIEIKVKNSKFFDFSRPEIKEA